MLLRLHHVRQACSPLWLQREFLWLLTRRELANRYAGSVAGAFWAYAQPALTVAAYWLVFDFLFGLRVGSSGGTDLRMGAYLIAGSLPWLAFCDATLRGTHALTDAGALVQKNGLPPTLIVVRSVLASAVTFTPLLLILPLAYAGKPPWEGLAGKLAAVLLLTLCQFSLAFLLAHILAILAAAMRDVLQVTAFVLSVGIYLTPVFFPITIFPEAWRWVLYANPMTAIIIAYQAILLTNTWPPVNLWLITGGWMLLLLLMLEPLLMRSREELVDWL